MLSICGESTYQHVTIPTVLNLEEIHGFQLNFGTLRFISTFMSSPYSYR